MSNEAELKFVREKRHGIAVVGSCLLDAAARLGVFVETECGREGKCDSCAATITAGADLLSPPTPSETEQLSESRRKNGERLCCQARIIKAGEISVMTQEKKTEQKSPEQQRAEAFKKDFAALPLEKKIERLVELETIAFGDTFAYVLNAPYTLGGKIVDFLAQYGFRLETEDRERTSGETASDKGTAPPEPERPAKPKSARTRTGKRKEAE
jgi:ferredoxin